MNQTTKRALALVLTGALTLSLAACGGKDGGSSASASSAEDSITAPEPKPYVEIADDAVLMTVNGTDITMGEYRDYGIYVKTMAEQYYGQLGLDPETLWSQAELADELFGMVDDLIIENQAIFAQQEQLGLPLTDADQAEIDAEKQLMIDQLGGRDAFEQWLTDNALHEGIFDMISRAGMCSQKVSDYYYGVGGTMVEDEDALRAAFDETYFKAKHILIKSTDDSGQALEGDALTAQQNKLKEVQDKLAAGGDFDALMQEYSEDGGLSAYPDGYLFTLGEMVDEFYEATKALAIGEVSEPVESSYGWHIIRREQPTEEDYLSVHETLAGEAAGTTFDDLLDEWREALEVTYTDAHDQLTIQNLTGA